jgi:hypothetical protein
LVFQNGWSGGREVGFREDYRPDTGLNRRTQAAARYGNLVISQEEMPVNSEALRNIPVFI